MLEKSLITNNDFTSAMLWQKKIPARVKGVAASCGPKVDVLHVLLYCSRMCLSSIAKVDVQHALLGMYYMYYAECALLGL